MRIASIIVASALAVGLAGCGSSTPLESCPPGATVACRCPSGAASFQICGAQGKLGQCQCTGQPSSDAAPGADGGPSPVEAGRSIDSESPELGLPETGSVEAGPVDAGVVDRPVGDGPVAEAGDVSSPPVSTGCAATGLVVTGQERLIEMFVVDAGVIVVRSDAIQLIGRDRKVQKTLTAPRPITTASFDGTSLAVADAALITIYSAGLESQGTILLTESCASSVLVNGGVFVCGPANDWNRIFYTYSLKDGKSIARSSGMFTYHGIPMRRVPGTNDFITVSVGTSPSDFFLYRVAAGGADVTYVNESPYHGDFAATTTFGFDGQPPTHLVNLDGLLLRIYGDGCDGMHNSFTSGCFVKDGNLGTLWTNQRFVALGNDGAGQLFAVANPAGQTNYFLDPLCPGTGCIVQQIDITARKVVAQKTHQMAAKRFIALRPDTACKMVAVAYELATSSSSLDYSGYRVDLLDYDAP